MPKMLVPSIVLCTAPLLGLTGCDRERDEDTSETGEERTVQVMPDGDSWLCLPAGTPPFAGALYNHGGLGDAVGGDLEGTCRALAEAGYIGYSKQRRLTTPLTGHIDDVMDGLDALLAQPDLDASRVAILGFSRGGLLTLMAAKDRPDAFAGIVMMAPAAGNETLDNELADVSPISAPSLILVSENDTQQDMHVDLARDVETALTDAGKEVEFVLYPPYGADGHTLFFEVGDYWPDVTDFLQRHL